MSVDAERWRAEQHRIREAVRARGGSPQAPLLGAGSPLVSVVVVCWNATAVIGRCLAHLIAQDYPSYEVVVVDDGSSDGSASVAERAAAGVRVPVEIVRCAHNRGCPHARNVGIDHARGELVAFIDADGFAAPDWLSRVVAAFGEDPSIGGVASTVFFDANPLVLNGAGGTVNRQGWAADLALGSTYERAELASEALYAMGCGMAFRRSAIERIGRFDDRMLNYYDDVDYGMRLWRSGYRLVVAPDAWIDHGFEPGRGTARNKQLLCERHRLRVALKHTPAAGAARWAREEALAFRHAPAARRRLRLRAIAWNLPRLPGALAARLRARQDPAPPRSLVDPSFGDGFPAGVPLVESPRPGTATTTVDAGSADDDGPLLYGWFPAAPDSYGGHRWGGVRAGVLIRIEEPVKRVRLEFTHVPVDNGGVDAILRRLGSPDPLEPVWSTRLEWQAAERVVENRRLDLPAGDYELIFSARRGWRDPPRETRLLGLALRRVSFIAEHEISGEGLDMRTGAIEDQLLYGWFDPEDDEGRRFRWATARAAAIVRVRDAADAAHITYRMAPGPIGGVDVAVHAADSSEVLSSTRISWQDGDWHDLRLPLALPAGEYVVVFTAEATWSNADHRDPALPPESRALGIAVSSFSFEGAARARS